MFALRWRFLGGIFVLLLPISNAGAASRLVTEHELAEKLKIYRTLSSMKVAFKQTKFVSDVGVQLKSEGRLEVVRPDRVTWEILKPGHVRIDFDKERIRIESGKEVQVYQLSDAPSERVGKSLVSLTAWLRMDAALLASQYAVEQSREDEFVFRPKQYNESPFSNMVMKIGKDGQLRQLTIHEQSGDRLEIEFSKPALRR